MVPAFDEEKVTSGVVSVPGVTTGVTIESDGALVETVITNDGNVITLLRFVFASLTATVQSLYVSGTSTHKVNVLLPTTPFDATPLHDPP
jgi:hypothetical protein